MSEKSYVSVQICSICEEAIGVLLDRRLEKSLNPQTVFPTQICDKCKEKYLSKGVLLLAREEREGKFTGQLAVIKDEAYKRMFNIPIPAGKIVFIDVPAFERIFKKTQEGEKVGKTGL
jgi:hypothetical protein